MKNKGLITLIAVVVILGILYWVYTKGYFSKLGLGSMKKTIKVTDNGVESNCNYTVKINPLSNADEVCTAPIQPPLYNVVNPVKERWWTETTLGVVPDPYQTRDSDGEPSLILTDVNGKKWYYNQTRPGSNGSPDKYYFVDDIRYPFFG